MTSKPTLENWREEIWSFLATRQYILCESEEGVIKGYRGDRQPERELKSFISSLLLSLLERVKLRDPEELGCPGCYEGYTEAVSDLESLKKKLREECK